MLFITDGVTAAYCSGNSALCGRGYTLCFLGLSGMWFSILNFELFMEMKPYVVCAWVCACTCVFRRLEMDIGILNMIQGVGGCQHLRIWKLLQNLMNWWPEMIEWPQN